MTTKYEEAVEAMRYGPIVAKEEERVDLLREAINEALEETAAKIEPHICHGCVDVPARIRALKKEAM